MELPRDLENLSLLAKVPLSIERISIPIIFLIYFRTSCVRILARRRLVNIVLKGSRSLLMVTKNSRTMYVACCWMVLSWIWLTSWLTS